MSKVQKVYTREFKEQAVQLAQSSGKSIAEARQRTGHLSLTLYISNLLTDSMGVYILWGEQGDRKGLPYMFAVPYV